MEEELPEGTDGANGADAPPPAGGIPPLPAELSAREQELRALIDAGAASPEELRELAAKLKEQRTYERSLWQREVRPALMQAKKKRPSLLDLRRDRGDDESNSRGNDIGLGVLLLVALVLFLIATQTSFLILLVAAVGVLVYAWVRGLDPDEPRPPDPPPADTTD